MELMQASFDDAFPGIPLPNLGSGISRIHIVTFSLFNSFDAAPMISAIPNAKSGFKLSRVLFPILIS
jgi:hypothetical protein